MPPTTNEDGSPLITLAGYVIRYGTNPGAPENLVVLDNPGITTYVVDNLPAGTWYFTIASKNADGVESKPIGPVSTTIG